MTDVSIIVFIFSICATFFVANLLYWLSPLYLAYTFYVTFVINLYLFCLCVYCTRVHFSLLPACIICFASCAFIEVYTSLTCIICNNYIYIAHWIHITCICHQPVKFAIPCVNILYGGSFIFLMYMIFNSFKYNFSSYIKFKILCATS